MHKKVQSLVLAGMISANTLYPVVEVFANTKTGIESKVNSVVKAEEEQIYLSDMNYEKGSKAGWGEIRKDTNVDGNGLIKLNVDGETKEFEKGMAAHATSTLIYNVSQYKDTYTRFVSYLGIDAGRGSNGNGVKFTISLSEDGQNWTEVKTTDVLKGNNESVYVDIELGNANYIKLYAHDNGADGSDHAVYGDAKLVKPNYSLSGTPIEGLQTVAQYDAILKNESINNNITNNKMTILRRALVQRVGYESLQRIAGQDVKYNEGINYLISNEKALNYFIMGGPVNMHGSYQRSLKSFCEIYDKYSHIMDDTADDNFNLRLAISIALSYSRTETVGSWMKSQKGVNPVHRYEVYQYLVTSGKMDEGGEGDDHKKWSSKEFKALPIPMMRWSVDARMNDDEILWLVDYALSEKDKGKNYFDAYNYIVYTMGHNFDNPEYYKEENRKKYNDKYNFEKYFSDYGTPNQQRMWMAFEEGTVCGGLTQTYAVLADVFGRPSSPCGQPGHAAAATYEWNRANQRYEWVLQNDISGWVESGNQFDDRMLGWGDDWKDSWSKWTNASYTVLASDAVLKWEDYTKANLLVLLADSYNDGRKKECYEKALEHQKINLDAWERLINCYTTNENTTSSEYFALAKKIIDAYAYYPQAMVELLGIIESKVTDPNEFAQLDVLKNNALVNATKATPQESTCVNMTKQMANHYLKNNQSSELATFSFDGENAGKIVLNSKYEGSQIRVRYSLDGGQTWEQTDKHIIELSKDQINSITGDNDIKVGLVGTDVIHTIDILAGKTVSGLYANDLENLLIGSEENLMNLEFSTDDGQTWCDYIGGLENGIRIEGDKTVKVRYKSYGQYLKSNEVSYNFTASNDSEERKYVQLKNVSLVDCSTPNSDNYKGEHLLDGTPNTGYHTRFGQTTQDKFFTVEFDKERYITSIEYQSNGYNGKMRSGRILTSLDGENWTESGRFDEIGYNHNLKTLNLDQPTACKYLKIVADKTYGNSEGEVHMYLSGNMLSFYEDTTIIEDTPTTLPDDVPVDTTDTPTVLPDDVPVDTTDTPTTLPDDVLVEPDTSIDPDGFKPVEDGTDKDKNEVDEEGADTPVTLPDDVPVEDDKEEIPQPPVDDNEITPDTNVPEVKPEEETPEQDKQEFINDVIELVKGEGEEDNPYEFIVKDVELDKFNSFLDELKEWSIEFISVAKEDKYTLYKLKLDKKLRSIADTIHIVLKVEDEQTKILSALNELGKELHPSTETDKFEEVLDGTANDDMMVAPEIETPSVDTGVTPDKDDTTNNSSVNNGMTDNTVTNGSTSNNTSNSTTNNPTTGDVGIVGYVGLGLASVLGLFKNRRRK